MEEQLVTFETAKLAKEKGFDCKTDKHYSEITDGNGKPILGYVYKGYSAPTQSLLQKWLREVHGINIFMTFKPNIKKWDFIPYFMSMDAKEYIEYNSNYTKQNNKRRFDTYEDALEIGLQEALKLI